MAVAPSALAQSVTLFPADQLSDFVLIGQGVHGSVYRAIHATLGAVAVKYFTMPPEADAAGRSAIAEAALREVRVLAAVQHPSVVRVHGAVLHDIAAPSMRIGIVMELMSSNAAVALRHPAGGGPSAISTTQRLRMVSSVSNALAALHAAGIVHGDLKAANVLVSADGETAKLCDFGLAYFFRHPTPVSGATAAQPGSLLWRAPELMLGGPAPAQQCPATDVFAFGVVMWELLSGCTPYADGDAPDDFATDFPRLVAHATDPLRPSLERLPADLPPDLRILMGLCWATDPAGRPDMAAVTGWLGHSADDDDEEDEEEAGLRGAFEVATPAALPSNASLPADASFSAPLGSMGSLGSGLDSAAAAAAHTAALSPSSRHQCRVYCDCGGPYPMVMLLPCRGKELCAMCAVEGIACPDCGTAATSVEPLE